jgi:hypothetical protein
MVNANIIKEVNEAVAQGVPFTQIKQILIDHGLAAAEITAVFNSIQHAEEDKVPEHVEQNLQEQKEQVTNVKKVQTESSLATSQIAQPVMSAEVKWVQLVISSIAVGVLASIVSGLVFFLGSFMLFPSSLFYLLYVVQAVIFGMIGLHVIKKNSTSSYSDAIASLLCAFGPMCVTYFLIFVVGELVGAISELGDGATSSLGGLLEVSISDPTMLIIVYFVFMMIPFIVHILKQKNKMGLVLYAASPIVIFGAIIVSRFLVMAILSGVGGFT